MARYAHIVFGFAVALLLAGCSRDAEPQAGDSLYWTPLDGWKNMGFEPWPEPLVLQLSADPVVYISTGSYLPPFPPDPLDEESMKDGQNEGVVIMPSTLDEILPRIAIFQGAQDALERKIFVAISGDDLAPCSSVLKTLDYAKRAKVEHILFTTTWQPSGIASTVYPFLRYFEFPNGFNPSKELANKIVTISISKDEIFRWKDTPVTLEGFINELMKFSEKAGMGCVDYEALAVIRVDADTPYNILRYALEQVRRAGIPNVMIAPL